MVSFWGRKRSSEFAFGFGLRHPRATRGIPRQTREVRRSRQGRPHRPWAGGVARAEAAEGASFFAAWSADPGSRMLGRGPKKTRQNGAARYMLLFGQSRDCFFNHLELNGKKLFLGGLAALHAGEWRHGGVNFVAYLHQNRYFHANEVENSCVTLAFLCCKNAPTLQNRTSLLRPGPANFFPPLFTLPWTASRAVCFY